MTSTRHSPQPVWLVLAILVVAELNYAFEASMIYVALTKLNAVYGDPLRVGWLVTAYLVFSAAAAALCGRLGDKYGRREVLLWMLGFAFIGSLISAFGPSLSWVIAGRAVQGISAAIMPLCLGLVRERLPAEKVPSGVGVIIATASLGGAAGYTVGGIIIDNFEWQMLFKFSAALAVLGLLLAQFGLKPTPSAHSADTKKGEIDIAGGVLFVPGIVGILLAITNARSWGWLDQKTLALLGFSLLILAVWAWLELRHPTPLLDVRLLMDRQVGLANICWALAAVGVFLSQLVLFPLLQQPEWTGIGLGLSATAAGAFKAGALLFGVVGASWSGYLAGRRGARYALLVGSVVLTAAWAFLTLSHSSLIVVVSINVIAAFSAAFLYSALANLIVEAAPAARASEATGMAAVVRAISGALGAQFIAYLLSSSTVSNPALGPGRFPDDSAYTLALAWVTLTTAACLVCGLMLPKRFQAAQPRAAVA